MAYSYPLMLDVTDRLAVIIGGGAVAARKAHGLLSAGAGRIRCVSPSFCKEVPESVERIIGLYQTQHLDRAGLVFAATNDPEVNSIIVRDALRLGIPVNRADSDEDVPGDFVTPAKLEAGAVIVTVSAGSAALAAVIRNDLLSKLDHRFIAMADAMLELRPMIRASQLSPKQRAEVFRGLTGDDALAALEAGGKGALLAWLVRRYPELKYG